MELRELSSGGRDSYCISIFSAEHKGLAEHTTAPFLPCSLGAWRSGYVSTQFALQFSQPACGTGGTYDGAIPALIIGRIDILICINLVCIAILSAGMRDRRNVRGRHSCLDHWEHWRLGLHRPSVHYNLLNRHETLTESAGAPYQL